MKKLWIVLLVIVMVLAFAACGGGGGASSGDGADAPTAASGDDGAATAEAPADTPAAEAPAADTPAGDAGSGAAMASLIDWMKGGKFSYDFELTSEGPEGSTHSTGSMAADGGNMSIAQIAEVEGQKVSSKIIIKDGVTYIVDDASKTVIKMSNAGAEMTSGMMTDYTGIELMNSGEGEINGKTLPYEEYTESEQGSTIRYYLDGGQVYGWESEYEGYKTVMIITNSSQNIPSGAFDIPSGYTEMSF
ncbi:MAG: hypothetical protein LBN12_04230 [Clostridiales Family XIII bacterium]|jgi:hypothetical protein|nr:hypothetical protein [Clostridiales Family XIII bacterium]